MKQVLEYIIQNYAWFLGGIILILLAIVGYHADKTNFGQGKSPETKKDDLGNEGVLNDETISENLPEELYAPLEDNTQLKESGKTVTEPSQEVINETNVVTENNSESEENVDINKNKVINVLNDVVEDDNVSNTAVIEEKTSDILSEEEFDKFNDEFNSVLPEKELISTDLLSDIDDLELDKTQKIDFSDITDLNNIELPKIKKFVPEEEDIWKF